MENDYIDKIKISCVFNYLIFGLNIIAFIIMFTGFKFMFIEEPNLETTGLAVFKFFTVDSNFFMGIIAFLFAYQEKKLLSHKIQEIPSEFYLFKHIATVSVSITMLVVFLYLGNIATGGLISLLQNSNLLFHFVIPFLSIANYLLFERSNKLKFKQVTCGLIPVLLYGIYYVINILYHMEDGKVLIKYDWYCFAQNGVSGMILVAAGMFIFTYVISLLLWILNRKKN